LSFCNNLLTKKSFLISVLIILFIFSEILLKLFLSLFNEFSISKVFDFNQEKIK
jgi:hypothetical protein